VVRFRFLEILLAIALRLGSKDIFATRADLIPGLESIESKHNLQYVLFGMFKSSTIAPIFSALEIEDLGIAHHGDCNHEKSYIVADAATEIKLEKVHQRNGGVLYSVGLVVNPAAFVFRPGGMFEDRCLIGGHIGTATGDPTSIALWRAFVREVIRGFTRIHSYYIGPEALRLLDEGMRLTAKSPCAIQLRGFVGRK
jgi:hypothetical protein